jgi:hypothetical protein
MPFIVFICACSARGSQALDCIVHEVQYFTGISEWEDLIIQYRKMLIVFKRAWIRYKASIDAKFYRFVSGFAITLHDGDGSFRKFLVTRNWRICGAAVETL